MTCRMTIAVLCCLASLAGSAMGCGDSNCRSVPQPEEFGMEGVAKPLQGRSFGFATTGETGAQGLPAPLEEGSTPPAEERGGTASASPSGKKDRPSEVQN